MIQDKVALIKYKDFAPRITKRGPFGGASEYESFSEVVSAVNQWIENTTIQVINVETVVLPDRIEGTSDGVYGVTTSNAFYPVMISQGLTINYFQCVRVWYRE
ncbi:hypothetical protein ACL6C3_15480 [Capilliphycus salinus ALCB114379]|uniref:hypothetical protein n=1 Tax=Capilliphycus salinus TaxID=2768948 RepID=UPI0039A689D4